MDIDNMMADVTRKRPLGVTIIAVLVAIAGIFTLISAFSWFFGVGVFGFHLPGYLRGWAIWYGLFGLIIGLLQLFFAWGLWTLQRWAYLAVIVIEILNLVLAIVSWSQGYFSWTSFLINMILPVVILVYFLADRDVREAFRVPALDQI
ncbi:MAG TPA: hypothetical protein VKY19_22115 [Ktedonosporobacter sp.]|jgi:hypothetical protein|nr:hypothetical protein [Ktedonosporobacter sp.]